MENVLMQVCRKTHNYSEKQLADKLDITTEEYIELETSAVAMTPEQARKLTAIFNIDADYFLESSQQLELLLTRGEIIRQQKDEIEDYKKYIDTTNNILLSDEFLKKVVENDQTVSDEQQTLPQ